MNNVVDEVLAGSPRYTIKDNGGTTLYDNVQIDLKTQVTTQGTPLNKALFDSIQSDLTSLNTNKLNVSDKATTQQAQEGIDDTNYSTSKKVQDKLNYLVSSVSKNTVSTHTICDFTSYPNAKIITISGIVTTGSGGKITIDGTNIRGVATSGGISNTSTQDFALTNVLNGLGFEFRFDMVSKTFVGHYPATIDGNSTIDNVCGIFTTLTDFKIKLVSTSGVGCNVTIQTSN